ncbi:uncharacterized protein [Typha angustifolia]|uniref:uncharacterized protein n=1 Tax=Typha angustifolia TaxID=59011 RepID=UPI003C2C1C93
MAHSHHDPPPLKFDVKVVRLADLDVELERSLFIRYYIFAGDGRRIRIDTREISSTSNLNWSEFASFECRGSLALLGELIEPQNLVFELRWRRRRAAILGRITRSKLLGRGEVAWKDVAEAKGMSLEKWVKLHVTGHESDSFKLPTLLVELKIQAIDGRNKRIDGRRMGWKRCNCEDCEWIGSEEDMFQAATIVN